MAGAQSVLGLGWAYWVTLVCLCVVSAPWWVRLVQKLEQALGRGGPCPELTVGSWSLESACLLMGGAVSPPS